jgi:hypothetical protein
MRIALAPGKNLQYAGYAVGGDSHLTRYQLFRLQFKF